jgi:AcrR family transcriptional regulator
MSRTRIEPSTGRDRLLDEATALFVARGYAAVSMHEIAEAAGMTKAAPYYHFKDKEDLFAHVFLREQTRIDEELKRLIERGGSFREILQRIFGLIFEASSLSFGQLLQDLRRHVSEERVAELFQSEPIAENAIEDFFKSAAERGEYSGVDAATAHVIFLSLLIGYFDLVRHNLSAKSPLPSFHEVPVPTLVQFFLHGIS